MRHLTGEKIGGTVEAFRIHESVQVEDIGVTSIRCRSAAAIGLLPRQSKIIDGDSAIMKYHHLGIPTNKPQPEETYLEKYKIFCTDHEKNPFGIQWMRYEPECSLPDLVKHMPHVAFEVQDLQQALAGQKILIEPNSPSEGILVAFIECDGAPVEFLQFLR